MHPSIRPVLLPVLVLAGCAHAAGTMPYDAPAAAFAPSFRDAAPGGGGAAEMFEREGRLVVEAEDVHAAAARVREIAGEMGVSVTGDSVNEGTGRPGAEFVLRVPGDSLEAVMDALAALGRVRERHLSAREVSAEYHDVQLQVRNLRAAMDRYEALLAKADNVKDMMQVEAELARLRGDIDRVEGQRRLIEDKVARAVLRVTLRPPTRVEEPAPRVGHARFHPGLRGAYLAGISDRSVKLFVGGGLSLRLIPEFRLDFDAFRVRPDSGSNVPDAFLVTLSARTFSDLLGSGRNRFLNPWLGLRAGGGRVLGDARFAGGVEAGVELVRTKPFVLDLQLAALALAGAGNAPDVALQASLAAYVPF